MASAGRTARVAIAVGATAFLLASLAVPARAHEVACAARHVPGGDWPMFGKDLAATRFQERELSVRPPLRPVWTFDANRWTHTTNNEVTGYPVVAGGCLYVGSSSGNDAAGRHRPGWIFALNADTGDVVWQTQVDGGVYSTLAVAGDRVYAFVSRIGSPFVVALSRTTGRVLWQTVVDRQRGSDAVSSPIVHDGMVWVGVSGTAAEGDEADRTAFQGSTVLVAARRVRAPVFSPRWAERSTGATRAYAAGEIIRKLYTVPPAEWSKGYAGGSQWGTIAVDPATGYGYEGTGNPFNDTVEHANTNAVLKIDLDRGRSTFGRIVGSYKGDVEEYFPDAADTVDCDEVGEAGVFAVGIECGNLDLDFGATPNVFRDAEGRRLVSAGQKSGVVHFFDARTMAPVAKVLLGVPSPVGGMVGSAAFDGHTLYGPHSIGGYLWAIDAAPRTTKWITPTVDGVHWGPPVTAANGALYTVDLKGFLDAYDAATGAPIMHLPMSLGSATGTNPTFSWGGVTVARNLVYAGVGLGLTSAGLPSMPNGFVIAYGPVAVAPG